MCLVHNEHQMMRIIHIGTAHYQKRPISTYQKRPISKAAISVPIVMLSNIHNIHIYMCTSNSQAGLVWAQKKQMYVCTYDINIYVYIHQILWQALYGHSKFAMSRAVWKHKIEQAQDFNSQCTVSSLFYA